MGGYRNPATAFMWTPEERDKAVYIAKRALKAKRDPMRDLRAYMGMEGRSAELAVETAQRDLRLDRLWMHKHSKPPLGRVTGL